MYPADLHFHRYYPRDIESTQNEKASREQDVADVDFPQDDAEQALKKEIAVMLSEAGLADDAAEKQGFWTATPGSAAEKYRNRFSATFVS